MRVKDEVEQIQLSVGAHNVPAARLYQGFGFEPYGLENSALKVGEQYFDEVLMALDLRKLKQS
jgi:ribosomal protein S18 acetylase RimI-like enzyme